MKVQLINYVIKSNNNYILYENFIRMYNELYNIE